MTSILMFGTFDVLHEGHRHLFSQARQHGDHITVILARDQTVQQVKGQQTHFSEEKRKQLLERSGWVEHVRLGSLTDKYAAIKDINPDIICLGYDQSAFVDKLAQYISDNGLDITIKRLQPYRSGEFKSSIVKKGLV